MEFWSGPGSGSGSADPCLWLMDPDPAIFVVDLQDANKKLILKNSFFAYYRTFWRYVYIIFKDKKSKRSHKAVGIKVFLTIFAWWWKDPDPDPDPHLVTNGSGSGSRRPKNMWIRWIRIRIRIRKTGTCTHIVGLDQRGQCILFSVVFTPSWQCSAPTYRYLSSLYFY